MPQQQSHPLTTDQQEKLERLRRRLRELGSLLVTYSGGVDSTLLLKVAVDTLGDQTAGLLALSPSLPARERDEARRLATDMGARLIEVETDELDNDAYAQNDSDRCYHCKTALLDQAGPTAKKLGFAHVALGTNADDLSDHRPGHRAAEEQAACHPLMDAGLTKNDVRAVSRHLGLATWDKAEMACLASRIPYGYRVTKERLGMVEQLEELLRSRGFSQVRVRHHGQVARIEVPPEELTRLVDPALRETLLSEGRAVGFQYVAVDLEGYRRGAMNETL